MNKVNYSHLFLAMFLNTCLLIPFVLIWLGIFIIVFLGISSFLGGLFLLLTHLTTFRVTAIPAALYDNSLILFAYVFFFIGIGGLLLLLMAFTIPAFLTLAKKYYHWNQSFVQGGSR